MKIGSALAVDCTLSRSIVCVYSHSHARTHPLSVSCLPIRCVSSKGREGGCSAWTNPPSAVPGSFAREASQPLPAGGRSGVCYETINTHGAHLTMTFPLRMHSCKAGAFASGCEVRRDADGGVVVDLSKAAVVFV